MDFLRTRGLRPCRLLELLEPPIHIGSGDHAKGPFPNQSSPDFAVVMAQTSAAAAFLVFCPHIQ
jgi:hypothetical protein